MNNEILNTKVSDIEFFAAHDAYLAAMNSDVPGDFDENDEVLTKAYWGLGDKPVVAEAIVVKATVMDRVKAFFA